MVKRQNTVELTIKASTYSEADRVLDKIKNMLNKNNIQAKIVHIVPTNSE